jgi:hypothetical protein
MNFIPTRLLNKQMTQEETKAAIERADAAYDFVFFMCVVCGSALGILLALGY